MESNQSLKSLVGIEKSAEGGDYASVRIIPMRVTLIDKKKKKKNVVIYSNKQVRKCSSK